MPSLISLAADAPSVYTAARFYERMGFSVIPCAGKKPALKHWSHLQTRRASREAIDLWNRTGLLENVGVICGRVSGGLVVVDCDGEGAIDLFTQRMILPYTYAVRSGSGKGMHYYYYVRDVPPTTRVTGLDVGNIELRSDGAYVIAPPSTHPDSGKPYSVEQNTHITYLETMRPVVEWIKSLIADKHGGIMPPPSNARDDGQIRNSTAYGIAALRSETDAVANALPGERNDRLYRAALKMGSLIADGKLDRAGVEIALLNAAAALTSTDGESATRKTIASGIEQGLMSSRSSWQKDA